MNILQIEIKHLLFIYSIHYIYIFIVRCLNLKGFSLLNIFINTDIHTGIKRMVYVHLNKHIQYNHIENNLFK